MQALELWAILFEPLEYFLQDRPHVGRKHLILRINGVACFPQPIKLGSRVLSTWTLSKPGRLAIIDR